MRLLFGIVSLCVFGGCVERSDGHDLYHLADTPLNQWPMLECHDAATTYLDVNLVGKLVADWTQTQPNGGIKRLLDCGARAFDWRANVRNGRLEMHHGGVNVTYLMKDAVAELVSWANANTAPEDLILLYLADCTGVNCSGLAAEVLQNFGIAQLKCSDLLGLSVKDAVDRSKLIGGGHVFSVSRGCVEENYDPSVACSGYYSNLTEYTCYNASSSRGFPVDRMWNYLLKTTTKPPPPSGLLYEIQALWQESVDSVIIGTLKGSSLLLDEDWSQLNKQLISKIEGGAFPHISLFEVNNVCNHGPELLSVLRKHAMTQARLRREVSVV